MQQVVGATFIALILLVFGFPSFELLAQDEISEELVAELPLREVQVDDLTRTYRVYVPERLADSPGLIVALHGASGDAAQALEVVGAQLKRIADAEGQIVAYPNGMGGWNGCQRGSRSPANVNEIDDVGFIERLVEDMVDAYGIDPEKAFVLGYSGGGRMVHRLALERPRLMAGFAAMLMVLPVEESMDCEPSGEPVSILIMNGTADQLVPFEGGVVPGASPDLPSDRLRSTTETFDYWADLADLDGTPSVTKLPDVDPEDGSTVEVQTLASPHFEVTLVIVHGGKHRLPGGPSAGRPVNRDVDAVALAWEFFTRQIGP